MKRWYLLLCFFIVSATTPIIVNAADQVPLYSDRDMDKYRNPSDNKPLERRKDIPAEKKDAVKKSREKKDQDYWCKRATAARKKIEHAQRDVSERENAISQEQSKTVRTSRKINTLQGRLKKSKDMFSSAERDLSDIENEAHRKGIPPGWLRCQFE